MSAVPAKAPRLTRRWTAGLAAVAVLLSPLLGTATAQASPGDVVGTLVHGSQAWPDATLAAFVEGEAYSDMLRAPFAFDDRDHGVAFDIGGTLPDGLSAAVHPGDDTRIDITGTPTTAGEFSFAIIWYGTEGEYSELLFESSVESSGIPTTPIASVTSPVVPYDTIALSASVPGTGPSTPSGTVEFWTDPATWGSSTLVGSATLGPLGTATFTWTGMNATDAGVTRGFVAKYAGDSEYAAGTSAVVTTLPYIPTASGVVRVNGEPVSGAVVALVDGDDSTTVVASMTTLADGAFALDPGAVNTVPGAQHPFYVRATLPDTTVLYYNLAGTPGVTDIADAGTVSRLTWSSSLDITRAVPPTWSHTTIGPMRAGSPYSDSVTATSPTTVTYSISAGALPTGLTLSSSTGAITGTPVCATPPCGYSFEITATNIAGSIQRSYSGTLLPAGVPPTWTDTVIPDDLQVGVPVADAVAADGDATIVYAVASGALPPGLSLNSATGAITGTPTVAGDYTFRITATNDYGSVYTDYARTVAAAPELDLHLDFAPGTRVEDATTQISASGLKVGSTYTLTMHSAPVVLYTGVIGPGGGFTWTVALPADTPAGAHELVLSGIAPDGSTLTARAWFVLLPNGRIGAISYSGPLSAAVLALTGADALPPVGAAVALLVAGVAALRMRNRLAKRRAPASRV